MNNLLLSGTSLTQVRVYLLVASRVWLIFWPRVDWVKCKISVPANRKSAVTQLEGARRMHRPMSAKWLMRCGRDTHLLLFTHTVEDWSECAQTQRQTEWQKWKQYIRQFHSVLLADIA